MLVTSAFCRSPSPKGRRGAHAYDTVLSSVGGPHEAFLESGTGLSARMRHFDRRLVRTAHAGARTERRAGRKKDDARVGKAAALGGEIDGCSGTRGGREELAGSEAAAGTRQRYRQKALYTTLEVDWGSDQSGQQGGASLKESSGW